MPKFKSPGPRCYEFYNSCRGSLALYNDALEWSAGWPGVQMLLKKLETCPII